MKTLSSSNRTALILIVITIAGAGFAYAIPVFPVTYQESYQVEVPYDEQEEYTVQVPYIEQESYTVQVPYTTMEDKQSTIGSTSDTTIEGGYYLYWSSYLLVGRDVEFSVSASDTVFLYIFTASQYANYQETGSETPNEKESPEMSSGKIGFHVSSTGTYYLCVYNPHDGFLGIGKKNVGIYSVSIVAYWQEEVTKQRAETRYRDVTKQRTETRYRTVSKIRTETHTRGITIRVTLLELLSGSYKTD